MFWLWYERSENYTMGLFIYIAWVTPLRDKLVQSIQDSVGRSFTCPVLMEKISCFAVDRMKSITTIATKNICELFQPQISTKEPNGSWRGEAGASSGVSIHSSSTSSSCDSSCWACCGPGGWGSLSCTHHPTSSCDSSCCHQYRTEERGPQGQDTEV